MTKYKIEVITLSNKEITTSYIIGLKDSIRFANYYRSKKYKYRVCLTKL